VLAEKNQGKPPQVMEKILESGLKILRQGAAACSTRPIVIDPTHSVAQAIEQAAGEAGAPISVIGFVRFKLGEGVEKEEEDFAAEVARTAAGS
jgi:elongation factor Ts